MSEPKSSVTPLLEKDMLDNFIRPYFNQRKTYLSLVQKHGSPLWILESQVLKDKARRFSQAFCTYFDQISCYFAMKSNNHPEVAATLLESGFGLDVSSGIELQTALNLNATDIIFSGPGKTDEELTLAIRQRDRVILLLDSFGELDRLNALVSESDIASPVRVGIRLTVTPDGLWRKFGIVPEKLHEFWKKVKDLPHINFKGLQFHSSWNLTPDRQVRFITLLGQTLKQMPGEFNSKIEFIDIGGGYWPEEGEWLHSPENMEGPSATGADKPECLIKPHYRIPGTPIEIFAEMIFNAVQTHLFPIANCRICFEPGRWICHSAMHLLLSVVDRKSHDLVITDAGTNVIGWERFETDYFPVLNLSRKGFLEKPCHILGSLCTPHDVFGYAYFGDDIRKGDCLMIPCQGAYTYSLGQNFIKGLPGFIKI
ncbi:MAG: decarboxylase [Desulfobacula sp. GWF2_41_7]|nr:MAG: decarboxylase [Desulfobacula sp. GWF2_41_7]